MKFKVYHARNPTFMDSFIGNDRHKFPDDFDLVATIECPRLDDVFRISNHVDADWTLNREVIAIHNKKRNRSTSVGDIVVDADGKQYKCMSVGWEYINKPTEKNMLYDLGEMYSQVGLPTIDPVNSVVGKETI